MARRLNSSGSVVMTFKKYWSPAMLKEARELWTKMMLDAVGEKKEPPPKSKFMEKLDEAMKRSEDARKKSDEIRKNRA